MDITSDECIPVSDRLFPSYTCFITDDGSNPCDSCMLSDACSIQLQGETVALKKEYVSDETYH